MFTRPQNRAYKRTVLLALTLAYGISVTPLALEAVDARLRHHYMQAMNIASIDVGGMTMTEVADALPASMRAPLPVRKGQ